MRLVADDAAIVEGRDGLTGRFSAMGSPCEVLADTRDRALAARLLALAEEETRRVEAKYSRYRPDSAVGRINRAAGTEIRVDAETADLLDFAARGHEASGGLFDVTTGVLRKLWRFDGREAAPPREEEVRKLLAFVGWSKVSWERPFLRTPPGFEIDLGGVCKEYAADRALRRIGEASSVGVLVNLGGDIAASRARPWTIGIEDPARSDRAIRSVLLAKGGLASSGDTKRFVLVDGKVRGHILDPRTGCPVMDTPRSVTVAASTCTEAGFFSTVAMLHGAGAEKFLADEGLEAWCCR